MPVIRFPSRRARPVEVIHPTAPRVGIFVQAQRARSTGPQAHQHPYMDDEERSTNEQVLNALVKVAAVLGAFALGVRIARAVLGGHGL